MEIGMLIGNLVMGPLLLLFAVLFKFKPPKKRNYLYGYRTSRSMKSEEAWKAANLYANDLMLWVAIAVVAAQLLIYLVVSPSEAILWGCILMCVLLVLIIPIVENYLKRHFDSDGRPKSETG